MPSVLVQGLEAVLTIMQDCYGFIYPGGLFLAAVDIMLEKEPVVRAVKQRLQHCVGEKHRAQPSVACLLPYRALSGVKEVCAVSTASITTCHDIDHCTFDLCCCRRDFRGTATAANRQPGICTGS
jgi:hypothetical protein